MFNNAINEKGQALIMVLFCSVVALLFVMAVLFMVQRGEQVSGQQKRYETALDAADAGVSVSVKLLDNKTLAIASGGAFETEAQRSGLASELAAPTGCLAEKLNIPCTTAGCSGAWGTCGAAEESLDPEQSPDITFTVRGTTNAALYDVSAKIVDSRKGVTGAPPGNLNTGSVVTSDGVLTPVKLPYFYYVVEVAARQQESALGREMRGEVARLTYIYAD